nr:Zinc finger, CCHC-type [Ipomoea batatas]
MTTGTLSSKHDNNYYLIWKSKILFVLADYGLDDVLTTPVDSTDPQWLKRDESARHFHILPSLHEGLCITYLHLPTAKSIMDALDNRFNSANVNRKMNLFRCYRNHKMEPHMPINKHIFRMRAMAKELECAGVNVPDEMQAVLLLNSMPEDWCEDVERVQLGSHGCLEELSLHNATLRLRIASDARKLRTMLITRDSNSFAISVETKVIENAIAQKDLDFSDHIGMAYNLLKYRVRLNSSGSNFYVWEIRLSDVFYFSKVSYVLKDPKPSEKDVEHCKKWLADDLVCRHLILGAVDDDLFLSFQGYPSAKSMMDAIKAFFNFSSDARRKLLLKKYMDHQMSEGTSIIDHNFKMERLALKLKRAGVTIPDELQAFTLMDSMPESWFHSLIILTRDMNLKEKEMDLEAVRARLLEVGQIRELMARQDESEMSSKKLVRKPGKVVKENYIYVLSFAKQSLVYIGFSYIFSFELMGWQKYQWLERVETCYVLVTNSFKTLAYVAYCCDIPYDYILTIDTSSYELISFIQFSLALSLSHTDGAGWGHDIEVAPVGLK